MNRRRANQRSFVRVYEWTLVFAFYQSEFSAVACDTGIKRQNSPPGYCCPFVENSLSYREPSTRINRDNLHLQWDSYGRLLETYRNTNSPLLGLLGDRPAVDVQEADFRKGTLGLRVEPCVNKLFHISLLADICRNFSLYLSINICTRKLVNFCYCK